MGIGFLGQTGIVGGLADAAYLAVITVGPKEKPHKDS
jgi:hypothetical protein